MIRRGQIAAFTMCLLGTGASVADGLALLSPLLAGFSEGRCTTVAKPPLPVGVEFGWDFAAREDFIAISAFDPFYGVPGGVYLYDSEGAPIGDLLIDEPFFGVFVEWADSGLFVRGEAGVYWYRQLNEAPALIPTRTGASPVDVSVSDDWLALANLSASQVEVYVRHGSDFVLSEVITDDTRLSFGAAVEVSGRHMLILADGEVVAYRRERGGSAWEPLGALPLPTGNLPQSLGGFGTQLVLRGDSAFFADWNGGAASQGLIFWFRFSGAAWEFVQAIGPRPGAPGDVFGRSFCFDDGGDMLVGAPGVDLRGAPNAGAILRYRSDGERWRFVDRESPCEQITWGGFAEEVACGAGFVVARASALDEVVILRP